jgi:hypothetical protein
METFSVNAFRIQAHPNMVLFPCSSSSIRTHYVANLPSVRALTPTEIKKNGCSSSSEYPLIKSSSLSIYYSVDIPFTIEWPSPILITLYLF